MKLSDPEKLILTMLCQIHKKLGIDDGIDPVLIQSAIFKGQVGSLISQYPGIFDPEESDPSTRSEVRNILHMWQMIEEGYKNLSSEEKAQVDNATGRSSKFDGFDANNETDHFITANFLINDLEEFAIFKGHDLNSHMLSLDMHRKKLAIFTAMRERPEIDRGLQASQIIELLA
jgi:uncharacterized protein YfbU (UPF0304 family)